MNTKVATLQNLSLKAVCKDIVRHGMKWKTEMDNETSDYWKFRRMFSEDALQIFEKEEICDADTFSDWCSEGNDTAFLDLLLNPSVKSVCTPSGGYSTELLSKVFQNCKNLQVFKTTDSTLWSHKYVPFLKKMEHLVELDLQSCRFLNLDVMEAIADSLVHLKRLTLYNTKVDDEAMFALCGHKNQPDRDLIPSCSFTKRCKAANRMNLKFLDLTNTSVTSLGISCILTHIPTIHGIAPSICDNYAVAEVICDINNKRQMRLLPSLSFQLRWIQYRSITANLKSVLSACPRLCCLYLTVSQHSPVHDRLFDMELADSNLGHLASIFLECDTAKRIATKNFMRFWKTRGNQIRDLRFRTSNKQRQLLYDNEILWKILSLCPNVLTLHMDGFVLPAKMNKEHGLGILTYLGNVKTVWIGIDGEIDSVKTEVFKIIARCRKLKDLTLHIPVEEQDIYRFMDKRIFRDLEVLHINWNGRSATFKYD